MENKKTTINEVSDLIKGEDSKIYFVGKKDPKDRIISKFKLGLATMMAAIGMSSFGVIDFKNFEHKFSFPVAEKKDNVSEIKTAESTPLQILEQGLAKEVTLEAAPLTIRERYPSIDFDKIKTTRDVSKEFLGTNNFIALASEMEGFRGDLHKDPAVGMNIGFGYNITKRVQENKPQVIEDLKSIGFSDERITEIIDMSQEPQAKLSKVIKEFNKKHGLKDNQLITLEQGVGLLEKTQADYKDQAQRAFGEPFDKMAKNQQEVLTYAAYKAGYEALSKYKKAIKAANEVYSTDGEKTMKDFKKIAKEIKFYYKLDGKKWVLDQRAELIAHTFVNEDFLALQVNAKDKMKLSAVQLAKNKIDFSHLPKNLESKVQNKVSSVLDKLRETEVASNNTSNIKFG